MVNIIFNLILQLNFWSFGFQESIEHEKSLSESFVRVEQLASAQYDENQPNKGLVCRSCI